MTELMKNADGGDRWGVDGSNVIRYLGMQLTQEDVAKRMNELEQIASDLVFYGEWTKEHKQARKKFHELFATQ